MKKLLVALVAMTMVSAAMADGHSMIRLDGCFDGQCDNLNFNMDSDDAKDAELKSQNIALNYAIAFGGNWGAGITYKQMSSTRDGEVYEGSLGESDNYTTTGLSFYWNKDGSWSDSCFAALHYNMTSAKDATVDEDGVNLASDSGAFDRTDISIEYGHRFNLGSLMGVNWNWSPSVMYTMSTTEFDDDYTTGEDTIKSTELTLNVANVAVAF